MLTNLLIENVAVIEEMEIEFGEGFNCITGETAAGKSIIIDAINMILGNRASRDIIRTGSKSAVVQAVFYDKSLEGDDKTLILYREIHQDGRNICKINGEFVTVTQLKERGENLINIHGQHDNQSLLNPNMHIEILDKFASNDIEKTEYKLAKREADIISKQIQNLEEQEHVKSQRLRELKLQLSEIESVNPKIGEDILLEQRKVAAKNIDSILSALNFAYNELYEKENAIIDEFANIVRTLERISDLSVRFAGFTEKIENIKNEASEIAHDIRSQIDDYGGDGQNLEEVERRLYAIWEIKRKYGVEISDILDEKAKIVLEIDLLENSENALIELKKEHAKLNGILSEKIEKLYETRKRAAGQLANLITGELAYLQMPKCMFSVLFKDFANVEFLISTNVGEQPKPLAKIASGGELSRISLAIKSILAKTDNIGVLIFDEIDSGIGGIAAQTVAEKLAGLGESKQVFSITHLAQIASKAQTHFKISKEVVKGKTVSKIEKLDKIGRKEELARIIGGAKITSTTLQVAEEMLA